MTKREINNISFEKALDIVRTYSLIFIFFDTKQEDIKKAARNFLRKYKNL